MRKTTALAFTSLLMVLPTNALAQTGVAATDVPNADIQAAVKRAVQDLKPGVSVIDHLFSLPDMGRYNVGVAVVARSAGTSANYLSHDRITEIYYVLRGSGVQATGTLVNGTRGATVSNAICPSVASTTALGNMRSTKLGPGDVQIIPPGVGHGFTSIDSGGIEYLIFRIDPDHVLAVQ
jgi:mannose-6-phosphate isomerase-like protein (cupin superfamily)